MLTARQQHCLNGIGITAWQRRSSVSLETEELISETISQPAHVSQFVEASAAPINEIPVSVKPQTFDLTDWPQTLQAIEACHNCELANSCTRKVPGKGSQQADLMIIGEAPGHDEDVQGIPFVGRAGQLLNKILQAIRLDPNAVYITNILKCRPPNNRDPESEEIAQCEPHLIRQIELIQPKIICALGRIAGQTLLKTSESLGRLREKVHRYHGVKLIVTYHPAALLRNPKWKRPAWEDMKLLRREYDGVEL